jgi:hypothetical protein
MGRVEINIWGNNEEEFCLIVNEKNIHWHCNIVSFITKIQSSTLGYGLNAMGGVY